ncbi:MAG: hypothetical protein JWR73_2736 [Tardiphaga sp.]|nr:hypothetical protein [Tardiphaga sp.]
MMGNRSATVGQADITRTCKALKASGFKVAGVIARGDGVVFELDDGTERPVMPVAQVPKPKVIL